MGEATMFGWGKKKRDAQGREGAACGMPTVKFDPAKVTETVKEDLWQNIKSLEGINHNDFEMIYHTAIRSITAGRDLHVLYQALMTIDGMSKRRASDISLLLNNKASALIQAEGQEQLGISYATWLYSGALCGGAEQDAAHRAADRKPFAVSKGMFLNGEWTWPGRQNGCKCVSKAMVKGFDGYTGGKPKGVVE